MSFGDCFCAMLNFLSIKTSATLYHHPEILLFQTIVILAVLNFCHFISSPWDSTIVSDNCNFSRFYTFYAIFVFSAPLLHNVIILLWFHQMTLVTCWVWEEGKNTLSLPSFIFYKYFSSDVPCTTELEHMHFLCSWLPQNYSNLFCLTIYHVWAL